MEVRPRVKGEINRNSRLERSQEDFKYIFLKTQDHYEDILPQVSTDSLVISRTVVFRNKLS